MTTLATGSQGTTVGQRIKAARKKAGLSQERLAREIGTTRQVVIRWEKDKHLPNAASREKLAEATGESPSLFREDGDEEDEEDADVKRLAYEFARLLLDRAREPRARERVG